MPKQFILKNEHGETETITLVSRWIKIQQNYNANKRNNLHYYITDGNGNKINSPDFNRVDGTYLDYFTFRGRNYAIDQFYRLESMWINSHNRIIRDGRETINICAVDAENYYNPLYMEIDSAGECVRLYTIDFEKGA